LLFAAFLPKNRKQRQLLVQHPTPLIFVQKKNLRLAIASETIQAATLALTHSSTEHFLVKIFKREFV
jgi:hypothetical protein